MKIYEYLVKLKDQTSSKLDRISRAAGNTESKVERVTSAFGGLKRMVAGLAIGATLFIGARAAGQLGINMEQTRVSFATFLKDADKANQVIADLNEFSNVTPFDNDSVLRAGKSLLAFGTQADQLPDTLRKIGDISAGTGKNFNELATIYGKAKIAGTLYAEDINQLVEAGIPIMGEFAKALGTTEDQVKKMASEGRLKFKDLETAFTNLTSEGGLFFDLMSKQSETAGGIISTFQGKMQLLGAGIGEAFNPVIKEVFGRLIVLVDQNKDQIIAWARVAAQKTLAFINVVSPYISGFIDLIQGIHGWFQKNTWALEALGVVAAAVFGAWAGYQLVLAGIAIKTALVTAAQWALNAAMTANPIGLLVAAIGALIGLVTLVIVKYEKWGAAATFLLGPLGMMINLIQSFRRHWDSIKQSFSDGGIISGLKRIGLVLLDSLLMPLQQLLEMTAKIPGFIGEMAGNSAEAVAALRRRLDLVDDSPLASATSSAGSEAAGGALAAPGTPNGSDGASEDLKKGIDTINGGGSKQTHIDISFNNLIGEQTLSVSNLSEGIEDLEERIKEALLRVLNSANEISTQ